MEGNKIAHMLSVEGMCQKGLWAQLRTSFLALDVAHND